MYVAEDLSSRLPSTNLNKIFLGIIIAAVVLGAGSGILLAKSNSTSGGTTSGNSTAGVKNPTQDNRTFRDFAEGTIQKKSTKAQADDYSEGTHILVRTGAMSVALTSSVVDLAEYEGKKVKVFGETQKALKEGWLMDVGRVEVQ